MKLSTQNFPHKNIRAAVIWQHVTRAGCYDGVVCFSCGNASAALRDSGPPDMQIVEIGPRGCLQTSDWWEPWQIAKTWPRLFDATPGHLPLPMMMELAAAYRQFLGQITAGGVVDVPTGSGETITALFMAYGPHFRPVYDQREPSTRRDDESPLNALVDLLARLPVSPSDEVSIA